MCIFHCAENKAFGVLLVTLYNKVVLCNSKRAVKMQRSVGFLTTSDVAVYLCIRDTFGNPRNNMFYLIAYFLFAKLDWPRTAEIFG